MQDRLDGRNGVLPQQLDNSLCWLLVNNMLDGSYVYWTVHHPVS